MPSSEMALVRAILKWGWCHQWNLFSHSFFTLLFSSRSSPLLFHSVFPFFCFCPPLSIPFLPILFTAHFFNAISPYRWRFILSRACLQSCIVYYLEVSADKMHFTLNDPFIKVFSQRGKLEALHTVSSSNMIGKWTRNLRSVFFFFFMRYIDVRTRRWTKSASTGTLFLTFLSSILFSSFPLIVKSRLFLLNVSVD